MKICVIGLWHLGLVTSVSLAKLGFDVTCVDKVKKIKSIENLDLPINEKNLLYYFKKYKKNIKLRSTENPFVKKNIFWLTNDTKVDDKDRINYKQTLKDLINISQKIPNNSIVIISSQIPVGTISKLEKNKILKNKNHSYFYIPENLRLGNAINNFLKPDRIVIGTNSKNKNKLKIVKNIFKNFKCPIYIVSAETAEMSKHVINSFLACSISFINEISQLSSNFNIDLNHLEETIKSDKRIGKKSYMKSGFSFSGGTLARDVNFLNDLSSRYNIKSKIINNIISSNNFRKNNIIKSILSLAKDKKRILQIGLTYKKGTNTMRRSFPYEVYTKILSIKPKSIFVYDNDLKQKNSQFNFLSKKKYDLIIIFKQEKNLVSLVKKYSDTNTKIIDIYNASVGEGTAFDLDYGKIVLIVLCLYIAVQVS